MTMNNDLIRRKYIQEQIPELDSYDNGCYVWLKREDVDNLIDNAPSVKTYCYFCGQTEHGQIEERPQGEWKVYGTQGGIPITDYCSNCKYEMRWYKNKYNFCPNCGASMQKGGAE